MFQFYTFIIFQWVGKSGLVTKRFLSKGVMSPQKIRICVVELFFSRNLRYKFMTE